MALFRARVRTPFAPEEAFARLSDFRTVADWDPGVVRAERLDADPLGVGSRFEVVVSLAGLELPLEYVVREYAPPSRIVLEAESLGLRSYDVIRVEPSPGGAHVAYDAELTLAGPAGLFDPLLQLGFDRVGRRAGDGLARYLRGSWRERRDGRSELPLEGWLRGIFERVGARP